MGVQLETLSHAMDGLFICMRWNPWAGSDMLTDAAERGEHLQTTPQQSATFQQHPASEQTGWRCSSRWGVKRWQPKRSSEPSARPNEASQHSPSSVGCSWWRRKIVRCMNHISSLATRAFKFYFTNKSMKNPLTTHLLLALSCRLSFSNKPLHLHALCIFLDLWSLCSAISIRFFSSVLFSHYLLCQSHAAGLWKGGVFGVIFRCNRNTEGRVAWLEGERDRHNSAESCLKSEPQIFGSWLYTTLELPAPLRFQTHEIGNSIPPPKQKELERKGKRNWTG